MLLSENAWLSSCPSSYQSVSLFVLSSISIWAASATFGHMRPWVAANKMFSNNEDLIYWSAYNRKVRHPKGCSEVDMEISTGPDPEQIFCLAQKWAESGSVLHWIRPVTVSFTDTTHLCTMCALYTACMRFVSGTRPLNRCDGSADSKADPVKNQWLSGLSHTLAPYLFPFMLLRFWPSDLMANSLSGSGWLAAMQTGCILRNLMNLWHRLFLKSLFFPFVYLWLITLNLHYRQ